MGRASARPAFAHNMGVRNKAEYNSHGLSLGPVAVTAAVNGTGVDCSNSDSASVLIALGVFAGTSPTATLDVKESDDNVTFTSVSAANLAGGGAMPTINPGNANQLIKRAYMGTKRYLRVDVTAVSGTGPSLPLAALIVVEDVRKKPTAGSAI